MSKNFLFKFVLGLVAVAAAVLWLLSLLVEDTFGWFSLGWAITIIAGVFGVMFILRGLFSSTDSTEKLRARLPYRLLKCS